MAAQFGQRPEVVELEALAPGSDLEELCRWSSRARCDAICWVGHAPDVGQLTAALIGSPAGRVRFAKGGMAAVRVDGPLGPSCGELQWLVTAKLLGL
jgi:phosphohistidine phosphatase SixA